MSGLRMGEGAMGAFLLALGAFVAIGVGRMEIAASHAAVGPKMFPYLVATGLIVVGVLILREAVFGTPPEDEVARYDWLAVALVSGGLLAQMAIIDRGGWILAATALFALVARAFGSRRVYADAALGLVLSALAFVFFNYGLDLNLPGGVIGEMLTGADQ